MFGVSYPSSLGQVRSHSCGLTGICGAENICDLRQIDSGLLVNLEDKKHSVLKEKGLSLPFEIICLMCSTLTYSAGLQKGPIAERMEQCAKALKMMTLHFHHWRNATTK
jgi:hypothetical protein